MTPASSEEPEKDEPLSEAPAAPDAADTAADAESEAPIADARVSAEPDAASTPDETSADESDSEDAAAAEPVAEAADEAPAAPAAPAPPRQPAPTRRRSRRDPELPAPIVRAQAKYVRSSARKARLVCDNIRGKSVDEARAILALTPRAIARDWSKLLESAVANAEHNHELVGEDLVVKAVHADEGPTIKRFRPRAMGRATPIRKRTSHLTILLTPKD
jgi:ribosomal protein L22